MKIWKKMWVGVFFWTQCILNDETFSGVSYMIKQTAMRLGAVLEAGRPGHCMRWWHGTNSLWRERSSASNIDEISAAINFHTTRQSAQRVCFRCLARRVTAGLRRTHITRQSATPVNLISPIKTTRFRKSLSSFRLWCCDWAVIIAYRWTRVRRCRLFCSQAITKSFKISQSLIMPLFYDFSYIYRVGQKKLSHAHTFVHVFAKYWQIFKKKFYRHILWKICNKLVTTYTTTP